MEFRSPIFIASGAIDCEINHPVYGWIPFTADPNDVEPIGGEVFKAAKGSAAPYIAPPEVAVDLAAEVRLERNRRLREEVDPMVMNSLRWGDLTDEQRQAWVDYRRALLDVTEQQGFPEIVVWPTIP
jgi:hypothetical protein